MISDLDATLRELLLRRVPLDPAEVAVAFECPTRAWSAGVKQPTVNLYLCDVRENMELRLTDLTMLNSATGPTGRKLPPVHVDFSYVISAWAPTVAAEHHLLEQTLMALLREMVIGPDLLQGALQEAGPPKKTAIARPAGIADDLSALWQALDNELKPSIWYTVTILLDLNVVVEAPLVYTREIQISDTLEVPVGAAPQEQRRSSLAIGGTVRAKAKRGEEPRPVACAQVVFPRLGISARSDADGRFVVEVPRGHHRVRITVGDRAVEREVEIPSPTYDLEV